MVSGRNQPGGQIWDAAYNSLLEGQRQAQEFWSNAARSWGEMAGSWFGGRPDAERNRLDEGINVLRELNEATMSVAMAWMRLPLILAGNADRSELQDAISRLTSAQGRAFQLWIDSINRMGEESMSNLRQTEAATAGAATAATRAMARGAENVAETARSATRSATRSVARAAEKAADSEQRRAAASKAGKASAAARSRRTSTSRSGSSKSAGTRARAGSRRSGTRKPSSRGGSSSST